MAHKPRSTVLQALALCLVFAVAAPTQLVAQTENRLPVDQVTTQQKALFVENLVTKSVAAQTIERSGDSGAQGALTKARALVAEAKGDLAAGNYEAANAKVDNALRLINTEARRLSQAGVKQTRLEEAYAKRLHTVETFLAAYERVAEEKSLSAATTSQVAAITAKVGEARVFAKDGAYQAANDLLDEAYQTARGDIRSLREGETLTRSLHFDTPDEEYDYEKDRNDSHIMLLRFALSDKAPPASFVERIDGLRAEAASLRGLAEQEADSGQFPTAIDSLVQSTDKLLKALRMTGLYIPG